MSNTTDITITTPRLDHFGEQTLSLDFPFGYIKKLYQKSPGQLFFLGLLFLVAMAAYGWLATVFYVAALNMFVLDLSFARIQFGAMASAVTNFFLPLALIRPMISAYVRYYREFQEVKSSLTKAIIFAKSCIFTVVLAAICVPPYISFGESVKERLPEINHPISQLDLFLTVLQFHLSAAVPITDLLFSVIDKAYIEPIRILFGSQNTITIEPDSKKLPTNFQEILLLNLHGSQEKQIKKEGGKTFQTLTESQPWNKIADELVATSSPNLDVVITELASIYFSLNDNSLEGNSQKQSELLFFGAWGLSFFGFEPYLIVTALFPVAWYIETFHLYWPMVTYLTSFMTFSLCAYSADTFRGLIDMLHHATYQLLLPIDPNLAESIRPSTPGSAILMHTQTKVQWLIGTLITGILSAGSVAPTLMLSREYFIKHVLIDIPMGVSTWIFNDEAWGRLTQATVELPFLISTPPQKNAGDETVSTLHLPLVAAEEGEDARPTETETTQMLTIQQHIACENLIKLTVSEITNQTEASQKALAAKLYALFKITPPLDQTYTANIVAVRSHAIPSYTVLLSTISWITYALVSKNTALFNHTLLDHAFVFSGIFCLLALNKLPNTTSLNQVGKNIFNDFTATLTGGLFSFFSLAFMHYLYYKNLDILGEAKIAEQIPTPIFMVTGAFFTTARNALNTQSISDAQVAENVSTDEESPLAPNQTTFTNKSPS